MEDMSREELIPVEDAIAKAFEDAEVLMGHYRRSRSQPGREEDVPTFGDLQPSGGPPDETMYDDIHREEDSDLP